MILDTQKKVFLSHLRRLLTLLAFALLTLGIILFGKLPHTLFGLNKYHWAIVVSSIYLLLVIYESLLELYYIYFNDENNVIILRYFSLGYFNSRKSSIEIPANEFINYEIITSFGGRKTKIILHRRIKNKDAKYPPVSLTLLNKNELLLLIAALEKYKKS